MTAEAATRGVLWKNMFLEIPQNSQEKTCARVCQSLRPVTLLKKRLRHRCFPLHFAKFLRTSFLTEHLWWFLLWLGPPLFLLYANDLFNYSSNSNISISVYLMNHLFKTSALFKGTVMQIEKALINDRLRVSKVSWKFPWKYNTNRNNM